MEVCEYPFLCPLDEALYLILQPPPQTGHESVGSPINSILRGPGEYLSIWEVLPLELHCDKLVGSHHWL